MKCYQIHWIKFLRVSHLSDSSLLRFFFFGSVSDRIFLDKCLERAITILWELIQCLPFSSKFVTPSNFLPAFQYYIFTVTQGPFVEPFYQCVTYGAYTADWQEKLYAMFTLIFMFIIPLGILIYTYVSTIKAISGKQ